MLALKVVMQNDGNSVDIICYSLFTQSDSCSKILKFGTPNAEHFVYLLKSSDDGIEH
jgi:hypothetical protein